MRHDDVYLSGRALHQRHPRRKRCRAPDTVLPRTNRNTIGSPQQHKYRPTGNGGRGYVHSGHNPGNALCARAGASRRACNISTSALIETLVCPLRSRSCGRWRYRRVVSCRRRVGETRARHPSWSAAARSGCRQPCRPRCLVGQTPAWACRRDARCCGQEGCRRYRRRQQPEGRRRKPQQEQHQQKHHDQQQPPLRPPGLPGQWFPRRGRCPPPGHPKHPGQSGRLAATLGPPGRRAGRDADRRRSRRQPPCCWHRHCLRHRQCRREGSASSAGRRRAATASACTTNPSRPWAQGAQGACCRHPS
mmetsp:Transcript_4935/g.13675  ORF Transcript_4935/g.13675 Transcript_4935/m.13675 type:complete len:305 (+) Transcript_4935:499-1413(+)